MPTQHVWNRRLGQVPSSMSWKYASVRTASKQGYEAFGEAATKPGHLWADANRALPPLPKSTHTFVWEQQHWLRGCVCSGGQRFWHSVRSGRHTDQTTRREHQQLCFGQVLSSAAGLVQRSSYECPEGKITAFEESYDCNKQTLILLLCSVNYILLEIKPGLFLREIFIPTCILFW